MGFWRKIMVTIAREEVSARDLELRALLSEIQKQESADPSSTRSELNTLKGLSLVLLYAMLEFGINRAISSFADEINKKSVRYVHLCNEIMCFALHPELQAINDVKRDKKWRKKRELFDRRISNDVALLNESFIQNELQNIWANTIETLFMVLGIRESHLYDIRAKQYIDEIVEKRNSIAHGRESAGAVGRAYNHARLSKLHQEIDRQIQYVYYTIEKHIDELAFISPEFSSAYVGTE